MRPLVFLTFLALLVPGCFGASGGRGVMAAESTARRTRADSAGYGYGGGASVEIDIPRESGSSGSYEDRAMETRATSTETRGPAVWVVVDNEDEGVGAEPATCETQAGATTSARIPTAVFRKSIVP